MLLWSPQLIDGEIWSCKCDGISVYDTTLTLVRRIDIVYSYDVSLLPQRNVVIAGPDLCEMSKSGTEMNLLKMFNQVQ